MKVNSFEMEDKLSYWQILFLQSEARLLVPGR